MLIVIVIMAIIAVAIAPVLDVGVGGPDLVALGVQDVCLALVGDLQQKCDKEA
jgi:hypothetical protein